SRRRHHRRDRQRPFAVGPGFEAPAVFVGGLRYRRAGDAVAARAGALSHRAAEPDRGAGTDDGKPGPHSRPRCRTARGRRTGRSRTVRPRPLLAHRPRQFPLEIEERAVRRPPGQRPSHADDRRRSHDLRAMTALILAAAIGYILGSVPWGLLLTRLCGYGDIRAIGSGNIGATNVLRTGSKALAAATLALDLLKGVAAVLIGALWGPAAALAAAAAVVLGHMFPVWLGFRGGKGAATALGVLFALAWPIALVAVALWLSVAALSRYQSLAALVATAATAVIAGITVSGARAWLIVALAILVILRHHENIRRLIGGTEN